MQLILDNYKDKKFTGLRIIKLIFCGAPRAGKTTLRKHLLQSTDNAAQESVNVINQPSTPIAECCGTVFVERMIINSKEGSKWSWTVQKLDEIARTLLQCLDNKLLHDEKMKVHHVDHENAPVEMRDAPSVPSTTHITKNDQSIEKKLIAEPKSTYEAPSEVLIKGRNDPVSTDDNAAMNEMHSLSADVDITKIFTDAVKTGKWDEVVKALPIDKAMLIHVIDGGGQPSFQEIFPLLVSGPSLTLCVFKLTDELEKSYGVEYQPKDGEQYSWKDEYVVIDSIYRILSCGTSLVDEKNNKSFGCKILLVGTHMDQLKENKENKILHIARFLSCKMRKVKTFQCVHVTSFKDFIIGIDNITQQGVPEVKRKIEELISQKLDSQDIPAPWLVFDFILHTYAKKENLRRIAVMKCKEIAKICGVNDDDFEAVLHYLHSTAGTLIYYSDIPILKDWVITDFQLIFDSISETIILFFKHSSACSPHLLEKEMLCEKGQFKTSVLKDIEGLLTVDELLSLMQYRHVISEMNNGMYFMPSVLPKAKLSYEKPKNSSSILFMFGDGCCPMGFFCALTTGLLKHKDSWELKEDEHVYRNKISFYGKSSKRSYQIILSEYFSYYEVCLIADESNGNPGPNTRFDILAAIKEVISTCCKIMHCSPPSYGFYCPKACKDKDSCIVYTPNEHPALYAQEGDEEIKCCYTGARSVLTDEQKSWFPKVIY